MTYSNGTFSPHPMANPFNTRLGPSNVSLNPLVNKSAFTPSQMDPKKLQVPNQDVPMYGTPEWDEKFGQTKNLEVPNQDIPLGDQSGKQGFLKDSSIFKCHDGTIVDFKSGKVLYTPNDPNSQYWGNPDAKVVRGSQPSWNDGTDIKLEQLINNIDEYYGRTVIRDDNIQIDPRSAKYWLQAQEEASRLQSQMTDKQKEMIIQFEQHFPKSKLIEECKKQELEKIL